jgi:hypothetical protein
VQPDAGFKVPVCLPIVFEVAGHACVADLPLLDAVFPDLLDCWSSHCLAGTYTKRREGLPKINPRSRFRCCTLAAPIIRTLRQILPFLREG